MYTKDAIRYSLNLADQAVMRSLEIIEDVPLTFPTENGGCHPLWVLGHLTMIEGMIPTVLYGEKNPVADWQRYFGENSEPVENAAACKSIRVAPAQRLVPTEFASRSSRKANPERGRSRLGSEDRPGGEAVAPTADCGRSAASSSRAGAPRACR